MTTISGEYKTSVNGWESETLCLTGDCWLEVELPVKGRVVIKKAEQEAGPYPKAMITKWGGPSFRIRLYGETEARYIKVITSVEPNTIQYANI